MGVKGAEKGVDIRARRQCNDALMWILHRTSGGTHHMAAITCTSIISFQGSTMGLDMLCRAGGTKAVDSTALLLEYCMVIQHTAATHGLCYRHHGVHIGILVGVFSTFNCHG